MAVSQSLTLTQSSQSVSGNYSKVRILWKTTQTGESWNGYEKTAYYYVKPNGGSETRYSVTYTLPKGTTKTLVDKTITVNHLATGKGSVAVRTYMNTGLSEGVIEKSASLTLDTIPRATQVSLSYVSSGSAGVDMGSSVTINTPRAASSFTHDLAYSYGGRSYVSIATGVGTSKSWTVPDLASEIPNATSLTVTVRCITKSGGSSIGTTYATFPAKVPSSVVPAVSSVSVAEATAGLAAQFGAFIQGKSKAKVTISASGAKGSTIKEYSATLQSKTYSGSSWTSSLLSTAGTLALKVRVKDSRGRWSAYKTVNISVLAYSKPKVQALKAYRCDASGNAKDNGTHVKVEYQYSVTSLNSKNTASMKLDWKRSTAAESEYAQYHSSTALSANTSYYTTSLVFSVDYSFDIRLTLSDWFGATTTAIASVPSDEVIFDINATGRGLGIGKTSEGPGVDFGWDIVDVIKNMGSMYGQYKTHDGFLIQWGTVTITPEAVGTPTTAVVTFVQPFLETPAVVVSPVSSVPQNLDISVQRSAELVTDNKKAVAVTLTRSGTTPTGIYWLAVGKGAA